MTALLSIIAGFIPLIVVAAVVLIVVRRRGGRGAALSDSAHGATRVRLMASFGSRKGFGPFGGSHNNLNPLLILHEDGFEYRVVRRQTARYSDVAGVDARTGPLTANLIIEFTNSAFIFTGNTGNKTALAEALRLFAGKGCPLSERARALAEPPAG